MMILDPTTAKVLVCILRMSAGRDPVNGKHLGGVAQVEAQAKGWAAGLALAGRVASMALLRPDDLDPSVSLVPSEITGIHLASDIFLVGSPRALKDHLAEPMQVTRHSGTDKESRSQAECPEAS